MHLRDEVFELEERLVLTERVLLGLHLDQLIEEVSSASDHSLNCLFLHLIESFLLGLVELDYNLVDSSSIFHIESVINEITNQDCQIVFSGNLILILNLDELRPSALLLFANSLPDAKELFDVTKEEPFGAEIQECFAHSHAMLLGEVRFVLEVHFFFILAPFRTLNRLRPNIERCQDELRGNLLVE